MRGARNRAHAVATPLLVAAMLAATLGLASCSTKRATETTTETIEYPAGSTLPGGEVAEHDTQVRITRETTTVKEKESGCGGVVGCTGKVVWEVIKLPFRIVGFVVDLII